mgnify:CR=1 FL=1
MNNKNNLRLYKRYSVIIKHLQGFKNKYIAEMKFLEKNIPYVFI